MPDPHIRRRSRDLAGPSSLPDTTALPNEAKRRIAIEYLPIASLKPAARRLRKHSDQQIAALMGSIRTFDANLPVIVGDDLTIVDGHAVYLAMQNLGYAEVPVIRIGHLNQQQLRLYRLSLNKVSEGGRWDEEMLRLEAIELAPIMLREEIEPELLGFSSTEFDLLSTPKPVKEDGEVNVAVEKKAVSRSGDLWILGEHRLLCGDARDPAAYSLLLADGDKARMLITDPPYNVRIAGNVSGLGKVRHGEFAMASGEMSTDEFRAFLNAYMEQAAAFSVDGALHYHFMDWRHFGDLSWAGEQVYGPMMQCIVWNKTNAGMGTFYRSKHELLGVFKVGTGRHVNTFGLGGNGRYRSNVWDYAGANAFRRGRDQDLADHPTVKPTVMIMDAMKDVSRRGEVVLDCFGGSGTTLLAAERTGRRARVIEIDPLYVDVAVRRWEKLTGSSAIHAASGQRFIDVAQAEVGNV